MSSLYYIFLNIKYFKKNVIIVQFHRLAMTFLFSHTHVFHARLHASSGKKHSAKKVPSMPFCPEWPRFVPFDPQKSFLACVVAFLSCVVSFSVDLRIKG